MNPRATFEQKGLPVAAAIDDDTARPPGRSIRSSARTTRPCSSSRSRSASRAAPSSPSRWSFNNNTGHGIGRPRLSLSHRREAGSDRRADVRARCAPRSHAPADKRTPEQAAAVLKWFAPHDAEFAEARQGRARPRGEGAEAERGQGAGFERGLAAGPAAHAGRRLPEGDALPPPRRPGAEGRRRARRRSCKC